LANSFDWWLHLKWAQAFAESMGEGVIWPDWIGTSEAGWGAPVFALYPPLTYYLFASLAWLSADPVVQFKLYLSLCILTLAASTRLSLTLVTSSTVAAIAAALVINLPSVALGWHRLNMLPAAFAVAFLPLVIAAAAGLGRQNRTNLMFGAFGTAFIAWTHLPTLLMALVGAFVTALTMLLARRPEHSWRVAWGVAGCVLGTLIGAAPWLSALTYQEFVHADAALRDVWHFRSNFLFDPSSNGNGFRGEYAYLSAGVAISALAGMAAIWCTAKTSLALCAPIRAIAVASLVCCVLTTPAADVLYRSVVPLQYLQFPWRWQAPAALLSCMALAMAVEVAGSRPRDMLIAATLSIAALALTADLLLAHQLVRPPPRTTTEDITWALHGNTADPIEFRTRAMGHSWRRNLRDDVGPSLVADGPADITEIAMHHHRREWLVTASENRVARFRTLCFPGWRLEVNRREVPWRCSQDGVIEAVLPGDVRAKSVVLLRRTLPARWAGLAIGALALLVLAWQTHRIKRLASSHASRDA
jgi:hypothetical protein